MRKISYYLIFIIIAGGLLVSFWVYQKYFKTEETAPISSLDYFGFLAILMITFITGIVAGFLPARQASKMEPAEALRYE